jgi:hypothetical protein
VDRRRFGGFAKFKKKEKKRSKVEGGDAIF